MKRLLCVCLIISLLLCACSTPSARSSRDEGAPSRTGTGLFSRVDAGTGFPGISETASGTPEEAIGIFVQGIAAGNFSLAFSAFAIASYASHYELETVIEDTDMYTWLSMPLPGEGEFTDTLNAVYQMSMLASQTKYFILCLTVEDEELQVSLSPGSMVRSGEIYGGEIARFTTEVDIAKLESLVVEECFALDHDQTLFANYRENRIRRLGCVDVCDRIVLLNLDGEQYFCGFMLVDYGDGWLIESHGSMLAGMSTYGGVFPADPEQVAELRAGMWP